MILFPQDATEFSTFGEGVLSDAVSCIVTEERNGAYELEMRYPVKGKLYGSILPRSIIYAEAHPGDFQPFRVYEITKPIFGTVTYYARHISYDLSGIPVAPFTAANVAQALSRLSSYSMVTNPFTFWTDKSTTGDLTLAAPASARSVLGGQEGSILDAYGGEYEYDGFTVKLYEERGTDNGVSIRYGKNLVDLKQEENVAECYTGIVGYYLSDDGVVQGTVQSLGSFSYNKILTIDLSSDFEEIPTQAQVNAAAVAYATANRIAVPRVSLSLSYAQLSDEVVNLCDTVLVSFETLGIEVSAKVVKTEFNSLAKRYESIEIGDARQTVADTIAQTAETTKVLASKSSEGVTASDLATAISRATASITGVAGGYVVIHQDENGKPYEILIMDEDDIDTATKVWRWNEEGLGYSSTGYEGDYGLAMTADGEIVADFITTGTLDASTVDVVHLNANSIDSGTISAARISQSYTDDVLSQAFTASEGLVSSVVTRVDTIESEATATIAVEYALSTSSTTAPTSGWSTTAPTWESGKFMWQRTVTTYIDSTPENPHQTISNPTCIQGAKGEDGTGGLNSATVFLYRRSSSAPSVPTATLTYTFSSGVLSGSLSNWSQTIPASNGQPCYVIQATAASTGTTDTITSSEWSSPVVLVEDGRDGTNGTNGTNGVDGYNTAIVYLYKRATSASVNWTTTLTYNFANKALTSTPSGWSQTIPSGTDPLFVTTATAFSNGSTDTIPYTEWSAPVKLAENGADGVSSYTFVRYSQYSDGRSMVTTPTAATKYIGLYTGTSSTVPSYTAFTWSNYVGADGADGADGSDGQTLYTWIKYADSASGSGMSDSPSGKKYIGIANNKTSSTESTNPSDYTWSKYVGEDGTSGLNSATVFLYRRSSSAPSVPTATLTYTFSSGVLSGSLSNWSQTIPASNGQPCYVIQATAASTGTTDTITSSEWSSPVVLVEDGRDGTDGTNGTNGVDGYNTAIVYLYKRATSASINWTTSLTYNFSNKALTSTPSGWSQTIPSGTDPLFVTTATAFSNGSTDTIPYTEWSTPVKLAENGADGVGISSIVPQYYLSTSSTTQTGGSWSTTCPAWQQGKYIWTRSYITWDDGSTSYTTPQLDNAVNGLGSSVVQVQTSLSQQADRITAEVTARQNGEATLLSQITQTASSINAQVSALDSSVSYLNDVKAPAAYGDGQGFGWSLQAHGFYVNSGNRTVLSVTSTGAYIDGEIRATSGTIGGFDIGTNTITSRSGSFYVGLGNSASGAQAFWAGAQDAATAPFRVDHAGNMYATSGTFTGTVYAGNIASGATPGYISSGMCDINIRNAIANAFTAADIFAGNATATQVRVTGSITTPTMYFDGYQVRWGTVSEGRNVLVRNS